MGFLTLEASLTFTQLKKAFTKAPILHHFDPKHYIKIETNASGYAIGEVPSQVRWATKINLSIYHLKLVNGIQSLFSFKKWSPLRPVTRPTIRSS